MPATIALALNHVSLRVSDLERARGFYTGVLGLQPHPEKPNWLGVGRGCFLHLMTPTIEMADGPADPARHVAMDVPSLEAVVALLLENGLRPYQATVDQLSFRDIATASQALDFGIGTVFIRDPDGNVIEFVQKGRGILGQFDPR